MGPPAIYRSVCALDFGSGVAEHDPGWDPQAMLADQFWQSIGQKDRERIAGLVRQASRSGSEFRNDVMARVRDGMVEHACRNMVAIGDLRERATRKTCDEVLMRWLGALRECQCEPDWLVGMVGQGQRSWPVLQGLDTGIDAGLIPAALATVLGGGKNIAGEVLPWIDVAGRTQAGRRALHVLLAADALRGDDRRTLTRTRDGIQELPPIEGLQWEDVLEMRYTLDGGQGPCPELAGLGMECATSMGKLWNQVGRSDLDERTSRLMAGSPEEKRKQFISAFMAGQCAQRMNEDTDRARVSEPGCSKAKPRF